MGSFRCTLLALSFFSLFGTACSATIVETVVANEYLGTLAAALRQANLVDTLNGAGPFTVFAPDDNAFINLRTQEVGFNSSEQLLARSDLAEILNYHVHSGTVMYAALSNGMAVTTVQGANLTVTHSGTWVWIGNAVMSGIRDVVCSNGVIHIINKVQIPPAPTPSPSPSPTPSSVDASSALRSQVMLMLFGMTFLFLLLGSSPAQ